MSVLNQAAAGAHRVSPLKKALMTFMVLGAMGTTVGAGTFASFNAKTTNAAAFSTGTLVLKDTVDKLYDPTATACVSTGGGTTDVNTEKASCGALVDLTNASIMRPGEVATGSLDLLNDGSLSGTLTGFMGNGCSNGTVTDPNYNSSGYNGAGLPCQSLQFSIQEYTSAANRSAGTTTGGLCRYGAGATGVIKGTALTFPLTVTNSSNDVFRLTVNGTTTAGMDLVTTNTPYATIDDLAVAVQNKIQATTGGANVHVSGTTDNKLQITNPMPASGTNNIAFLNPTPNTNSAATKLGFAALPAATGGQAACTLGNTVALADATHTLGNFLALYTSGATGLSMGSLTPNQTRYYQFTMMLPEGAANSLQGKSASFDMSWTLLQS